MLVKYHHSKFFALQPINIIIRYYTNVVKSVFMVAPLAIVFIEFLKMVKIAFI